jgi:hypothetical protein
MMGVPCVIVVCETKGNTEAVEGKMYKQGDDFALREMCGHGWEVSKAKAAVCQDNRRLSRTQVVS